MKLYTYLDNLQTRALYVDTDSVLFIQPRDSVALVNTGDCLGEMTSELQPSEYMSEFVSGAPRIMRTKRTIQRRAQRQQCLNSLELH